MMDLVSFMQAYPGSVDVDLLNFNPDENDSAGPTMDPLHDFVPVEDLVAADSSENEEFEDDVDDIPDGLTPEQAERYYALYEDFRMHGRSNAVAEMLARGIAIGRLTLTCYDKGSVATEGFDLVPVSFGSPDREPMRRNEDVYTPDSFRGKESNARRHRRCNDRATIRHAQVRVDVFEFEDGIFFSSGSFIAEVRAR